MADEGPDYQTSEIVPRDPGSLYKRVGVQERHWTETGPIGKLPSA